MSQARGFVAATPYLCRGRLPVVQHDATTITVGWTDSANSFNGIQWAATWDTTDWHTVVATFDWTGDAVKGYLDGVDLGSGTPFGSISSTPQTAITGVHGLIGINVGSADPCNLALSQVCIWSSILTSGNASTYNSQFAPTGISAGTLVRQWPFDGNVTETKNSTATTDHSTTDVAGPSAGSAPSAPTSPTITNVTTTAFDYSFDDGGQASLTGGKFQYDTASDFSNSPVTLDFALGGGTITFLSAITQGQQYYGRFALTNASGTGAYSTGVAFEVATPLVAPTLTFVSKTDTTITVSWTDATGGTPGYFYELSWGVVSGNYSTGSTEDVTSPEETTGLTKGTRYYFIIAATDADGMGDTVYSNEVAVTPGAVANAAILCDAFGFGFGF
jgi:hypothetical protein